MLFFVLLAAGAGSEAGEYEFDSGAASGIFLMLCLGGAYLFPAVIAIVRGHHNVGSILVINVFFGWTVLGWIGALAMAMGHVRPEHSGNPKRRRRAIQARDYR